MYGRGLGTAAAPIIAVPLLASCAGAVSDAYTIEHQPAVAETIAGSDQVRVTVEGEAAERLDIRTARVAKAQHRLVVPSAAVFVDPEGTWWVYTSPEPLVFVRQEIDVLREDDGKAFLSTGPSAGTQVVIQGVPELYAIEDESGH